MQVAPLSERREGGGRQDRRIALSQIKGEALGTSGQADWVAVSEHLFIDRADMGKWNKQSAICEVFVLKDAVISICIGRMRS